MAKKEENGEVDDEPDESEDGDVPFPGLELTFSEKYDAAKAWVWGITDSNLEVHQTGFEEYDETKTQVKIKHHVITKGEKFLTYGYTYFSMAILCASVVLMCVETLPEFRLADEWQCSFPNGTLSDKAASICAMGTTTAAVDGEEQFQGSEDGSGAGDVCACDLLQVDTRNETLYVWEAVFVAWFAFELLLRFFASPDRMAFSKGVLNVIDLLAILPFFIELATDGGVNGMQVIRILRLVRVFRVIKLARHSSGLKIFGMALWQSGAIMSQLTVFLVTVSVLFSAMIFYAEYQNEDHEFGHFDSIPRSIWWAIVTMTTVGYGDLVPQTLVGQMIGSMCAMSGIFVIALPIPIFVENFQQLWLQMRNTTPTWQLQYNKIRQAKLAKRAMLAQNVSRARTSTSGGEGPPRSTSSPVLLARARPAHADTLDEQLSVPAEVSAKQNVRGVSSQV